MDGMPLDVDGVPLAKEDDSDVDGAPMDVDGMYPSSLVMVTQLIS